MFFLGGGGKVSVTFVQLEVYVDRFYQKSESKKIRPVVAILPEVLTGARCDAMTLDKCRR